MDSRTTPIQLDPPCPEEWGDEEGCDKPGLHHCRVEGEHRNHWCKCGAAVFEERSDLPGQLSLGWAKSRWLR